MSASRTIATHVLRLALAALLAPALLAALATPAGASLTNENVTLKGSVSCSGDPLSTVRHKGNVSLLVMRLETNPAQGGIIRGRVEQKRTYNLTFKVPALSGARLTVTWSCQHSGYTIGHQETLTLRRQVFSNNRTINFAPNRNNDYQCFRASDNREVRCSDIT